MLLGRLPSQTNGTVGGKDQGNGSSCATRLLGSNTWEQVGKYGERDDAEPERQQSRMSGKEIVRGIKGYKAFSCGKASSLVTW